MELNKKIVTLYSIKSKDEKKLISLKVGILPLKAVEVSVYDNWKLEDIKVIENKPIKQNPVEVKFATLDELLESDLVEVNVIKKTEVLE